MKKYKLIMTREQDLLLAKHIGEMKHVYSVLYKTSKEKNNEKMMELYKSYLDEVEELINLLLTSVFNKEKGDE